jgi:hypothetical protein
MTRKLRCSIEVGARAPYLAANGGESQSQAARPFWDWVRVSHMTVINLEISNSKAPLRQCTPDVSLTRDVGADLE